jgi:hypothetical protein
LWKSASPTYPHRPKYRILVEPQFLRQCAGGLIKLKSRYFHLKTPCLTKLLSEPLASSSENQALKRRFGSRRRHDLRYDFESQTWQGHPADSEDRSVKRAEADFTGLVKNPYRVLLSRARKGCFVYFMDKETEKFFRSRTLKSLLHRDCLPFRCPLGRSVVEDCEDFRPASSRSSLTTSSKVTLLPSLCFMREA